ncbi:sigma 54-interacting transcriptional regulator [Novosphingobium sp. KCTC 2891]|nr:sigma 54-interacting transcriptional regulator [Novosphingobium sp. KCTC 2891]
MQRAAAVIDSFGAASGVELRDTADKGSLDPRLRSVTLERGGSNAIARMANGQRLTLRYTEGASDGVLAALLACAAAPGAPIAADPESLSILALAERIAASDIPVLINGPTGTGKEVLSRFIHDRSSRAGKPFIAINCAAMPEAMLEAMLFGHQKGAFTGANAAAEGFFRAAHGGTLLLDEIAEMPLSLQAKLLRALQEGEVVPLGATQPIKVDVRIIACANRDLPLEVEEGRFRADLFYRLNVFPLSLRPLCERPEDIAPLAFALMLRHVPQGQPLPWIADAALAMLSCHAWPGNVRELENVVRRALVLAGDAREIGPEHIAFDRSVRLAAEPSMTEGGTGKLSNIVQLSEARAILATLEACGGSRVAAARQLGISERTLRYRLASFRDAGIAVAGGRR